MTVAEEMAAFDRRSRAHARVVYTVAAVMAAASGWLFVEVLRADERCECASEGEQP